MKVSTLGQRENPAIVMIPGMFCTSDMTAIVAKYLERDFYMILPTLDGHYREQPVYYAKQDDARELLNWLQENGVKELALLQGTSMGAEVALEAARQADLPIAHCLFDGGPFFYFPRFVRAFMAAKFWKFGDMVRGRSREEAMQSIRSSRLMAKMKRKSGSSGSGSSEFSGRMLDSIIEISQWIDRDSIRRIADTCYRCDLPSFDEDRVRRFTFLYSETELARKSEKRLRKKYPDAEYLIVQGYGHGGFQAA
ncbi:MAG: alpha/beta hydrolase, partial [Lachnospiraceae bacterium]